MATEAVHEARRLSDAALAEVMALIKDADSVELKVTIPASGHRATIQGLPLDPVEAQPRQIYFFDTPDLALNQAGVVVRARRIQGGRGDTVIKLRPVVPAELPPDLRRSSSFNVEVDVLPGGFVCSASFKGRTTGQDVRDAVGGTAQLRSIFSKEQRAFFVAHAPVGIDLESLTPLGPVFILKDRFELDTGFGDEPVARAMVAELWLYPDGSRILELSTRCHPGEAFQVAAETRAALVARGVDIGGEQQTKTKAALEYFHAELQAKAAAAKP